MTPVVRHRCGSAAEATALVLASVDAWSAGGEIAIAYVDAPDGVTVVVERVSDVAMALRHGPPKQARAA